MAIKYNKLDPPQRITCPRCKEKMLRYTDLPVKGCVHCGHSIEVEDIGEEE